MHFCDDGKWLRSLIFIGFFHAPYRTSYQKNTKIRYCNVFNSRAINVPISAMNSLKVENVVLSSSQPVISKVLPSEIEMEPTFLAREILQEIVGVTLPVYVDIHP